MDLLNYRLKAKSVRSDGSPINNAPGSNEDSSTSVTVDNRLSVYVDWEVIGETSLNATLIFTSGSTSIDNVTGIISSDFKILIKMVKSKVIGILTRQFKIKI